MKTLKSEKESISKEIGSLTEERKAIEQNSNRKMYQKILAYRNWITRHSCTSSTVLMKWLCAKMMSFVRQIYLDGFGFHEQINGYLDYEFGSNFTSLYSLLQIEHERIEVKDYVTLTDTFLQFNLLISNELK